MPTVTLQKLMLKYLLCAALAPVVLGDQNYSSVDKDRDAIAMISSGTSLPVEYQASGMWQLLKDQKLSIPRNRRDFLRGLFDSAPSAASNFPSTYVALTTDETLEEKVSSAVQSTGLSAFQIQLDVVAAMAQDDVSMAMQLLDEMQPLPPSVDCDAALVPDAAQYYVRVQEVFQIAARRYPSRRPERIDWLYRQFEKGVTFGETASEIAAVRTLHLKEDERQYLFQRIAANVMASKPSSRDFSVETQTHRVGNEILAVMHEDETSEALLASAYQAVLLKVLSHKACSDQIAAQSPQQSPLDNEASFAENAFHIPSSIASTIRDDLQQAALLPDRTWQVHPLDNLERFGGLLRKLFSLRDGPAGYVAEEKELPPNSLGWELDADAMLQRLSLWEDAKDSCPTCVFLRKSGLYVSLMDLLPRGRFAERCVEDYLSYMSSSEMQTKSPASWIASFRLFLLLLRHPAPEESRAMSDAKRTGKLLSWLPSPFAAEALNSALQSSDREIQYLVRMDQFAPLPYANPALH